MNLQTRECPHCGSSCGRDEADVGVGVIHGPWGCGNCGWSEDPAYDSRGGLRMDGDDRVRDPFGGIQHVDRIADTSPRGTVTLIDLLRDAPCKS